MDEEYRREFEGYLDRLRDNDPTLTKLDLGDYQIGDDGAVLLARALKINGTLTTLDLEGNQIGDAGATAIAEALKINGTLTTLDLEGNQIGYAGATAIAQALRSNKSIAELDIRSNQIGSDGAESLAQALEGNEVLTELNLGGNEIGLFGAAALARALRGNTTLTELNLSGNRIGDAGAMTLAEALKVNGALTTLNLAHNQIRVDGARDLAEALKVNTALTELNLGYNQIGADGAEALARALAGNETLTELGLWSNEITDAGAESLARALKENEVLTGLNLDGNEIGLFGAESLARALKENEVLTGLNLDENRIGSDGAVLLARALKINGTLTTLDLEGNQIGDAGASAIAEALKVNTALEFLDLSTNEIFKLGAMALADALKKNRALTKLILFGNELQPAEIVAINEGLQHVRANQKMFREDLFGEVAEKYHDLNKLSEENPVLPPEIYLTIVKDFLSAILLAQDSVQDKLEFVEMSNIEDLRLPNKDESAYLITKAFERFAQDTKKYPEHFINPYFTYGANKYVAEVARPICDNESVLLKGFDQLHKYDERLENGIIHFQESEEEGKIYKTATTTPFNQVRVDLDTLSRMLTKDVKKPEDAKEYKAIRGQQVEIEGLDFAQIVAARRPVLLLNIFRIAEEVPSLMSSFEEKMQENGGALLNIVAEMMPRHPTLQKQLQQVIDRVGKITEIVDEGVSHDKKRSRNEDSASKSDHTEHISQPSPTSRGATFYQLRSRNNVFTRSA